MPHYSRIQIMGHLGKDPETRFTHSGDAVCNFSIAVSRKRGGEETTTWFRCSAWNKTAEIVQQYVGKGDALFVEGEMHSRQYTDKDGNKRESWEVSVNNVVLLGSKDRTEQEQRPKQEKGPEEKKQGGFDDLDDDIPF